MQKTKERQYINIESLISYIKDLECSVEDWGDEESVSSFRYGFSCAKDKVKTYLNQQRDKLKDGEDH